MNRSSQFVKYRKFEPIENSSSFNMWIEEFTNIELHETIESKRIKFLCSDDVWWISVRRKDINYINYVWLTHTLQASDCTWKSRICSCSFSGTINGVRIDNVAYPITQQQTSSERNVRVNLRKEPSLELKLTMKISQAKGQDAMPLQKFIDTASQCKNIISNMESILDDSKYSDFTFTVNGRMFKVHRNILAAASPVFDKLFTTKLTEALTNECRVTDIEPTIFKYLLGFIYCGKLPEEIHDENVSRLLFKAAHYYQINELVDLCTSVEHYNLSKDNAVDVFEWADIYGLENVKMDAWKIIQFDILELFDAKQPPPIESIRSLIVNKEEKEKLLKDYQRKLGKLEVSTQDLLK